MNTLENTSGFSLLEVMIAFMIMSLLLIFSFNSFSDGLFRLKRAEVTRNDIIIAQNILSLRETGQIITNASGWRIEETPLDSGTQPNAFRRVRFSIYKSEESGAPVLETILIERSQ